MPCQIITVGLIGELVIHSEMRTSLGIGPGTRVAVTQDGARLIVEPVSVDLVDQTRGVFSGKPSLSEELKRQRRSKDDW